MSSTVSFAILASLLFVSSTMGHSQMRCAKYDPNTGNCYAPIRNQAVSYEAEANDISVATNGLCQSPWTNPITASYANGAGCPDYAPCPAPMGTYYPGENFYVQWLARNHATSDQTPGNISLYLSPAESVNQGADVSRATFELNKFCVGPFMSCDGQNGNLINCSTACTMPTNTAPGVYTLWWLWVWPGHTSVYSTCADINVVAQSGSTPVTPTPAAPTPAAPTPVAPTPVAPTPAAPTPVAPTPVAPTPVAPTPAAPTPVAPTPVSPAPVPSSPSTPSTGSCTAGNMKCLTSETYSMCFNGLWGVSQSCATGTTCSPSGAVIYCIPNKSTSPAPAQPTPAPVTPTPTPTPVTPAPVTPPAQPTPTPSQPSTSPLKGSCTMGYQQCTGQRSYQTCGNGVNGPTWAATQYCQSGLSCHPSTTANNIYCY